jgi:hypothetical protein
MVDPLHPYPVPPQLQLGSFRAVNEKKPLVLVQYLGRGVPLNGRNSRIAAKYDNLKDHVGEWGF